MGTLGLWTVELVKVVPLSGSYHYIVSGENTAYITHYGTTVNDATVSYNQSNITSRTLPTSVTFNNKTYTVNGIYGAFYGCTALRSVTIPNTYTYIGWKSRSIEPSSVLI